MRIYALGDIHGQLDMLRAAHRRVATDRARIGDTDSPVVHLGDLVDRGPDSRGVMQYLIDGIAGGEPWIVLMGNHDRAFAAQIGLGSTPAPPFRTWASDSMGGAYTALSYGVAVQGWPAEGLARRRLTAAVPDSHKRFLSGLKLYHETPDILFVHAGIRPGLPIGDQIENDLLWIRGEFLDDTRDHGRLIIHGHTPVAEPMHCGNRVNIDTGAGYDHFITAVVCEGRDIHVLEDDGRRALIPD